MGTKGLIFQTTDGGHTWTQISHGAGFETLQEIFMLPTGIGIAVGSSGMVLRTTDFGSQWNAGQVKDDVGISYNLDSVQAIDDDTFVISGHMGAFFRSDDAGLSWQWLGQGELDYHDFFTVQFVDESEGWLIGRNFNLPWGVIMHTTDGGLNWQRMDAPGTLPVLTDAVMLSARVGYAVDSG